MMTVSDPIGATHAAKYFRREHGKDYYVDGTTEGVWYGRGAAKLGLRGGIEEGAFRAVLEGRDPATGVQLVAGSSAAGGKRIAAWDVTFAAPKSVSVCGLIGRDARVLAAHDEAVAEALRMVEERVCGRVKGIKGGLRSGNIVVGQFVHETNRNLDPHLHTHNVLVNLTEGAAGDWTAVDSSCLFALQRFGTTVYRAALAERLLAAGYTLRHGRHGNFEIDGISDAQIEFFSTRTSEVLADCTKRGAEANAANFKKGRRRTRPKKQTVAREVLDQVWETAAEASHLDLSTVIPNSAPERASAQASVPNSAAEHASTLEGDQSAHGPDRAPRKGRIAHTASALQSILGRRTSPNPENDDRRRRADEAVAYAIRHVNERESVMTADTLITAALSRSVGSTRGADVERAIERAIESGALIRHRAVAGLLTTRETLRQERGLIHALDAGAGTLAPIASEADLSIFELSDEQDRAARHILTATDTIVGVQGVAGAGKTRTLKAVRAEAERCGFRVKGLAPTTSAAQELASAGLDATTVASHLLSPGAAPNRELWIVDEAGLLSTRTLADLVAQATTAGARIVLVGDVRQHTAVEAGAPFKLLQKAGMRTCLLREIYRQRENPTLLAAVVDASEGRADRAVAQLERWGVVRELPDPDDRHDEMAALYADHPDGTLVVAPTNAERSDLNARIRSRLRDAGRISGDDRETLFLASRDLTRAEREVASKYEVGHVVRYRRGSRRHEIAKDSYATVVSTDVARNLVTVRMANGTLREYDPARLRGVEVYRQESRVLALGDRVQFRAPTRVGSKRVANGQLATIVALSESGEATLHLDDQKGVVSLDLAAVRHLDYGYAVTSHSSQGKTVERALVVANTDLPKTLVNQAQLYVSISRATTDVALFTDDRAQLPSAVQRELVKESALNLERRD